MSLSGVLVLDKPPGMTSHDVVKRVRRKLATKKVGHAGTLDPDATGVLVLCVGDATRLLEYLVDHDKSYEGEVTFGVSTSTDDASGSVLEIKAATGLTEEAVYTASATLTGQLNQKIPAYSAVHVAGKRGYQLARAGIPFDLPTRLITIYEISVSTFRPGQVATADFHVKCSKGTYIRALCRDWGREVQLPAHMSRLRRTSLGSFSIHDALGLDEWERMDDPGSALKPLTAAIQGMARVRVSEHDLVRLANGQMVPLEDKANEQGPIAVLTECGDIAAVAQLVHADGRTLLKPKKVFWKREL